MKRFLPIILFAFALLSLAGCSSSDHMSQEERQDLTIGDLSKETYEFKVGETQMLYVSISPKGTDVEDINIKVSDSTVIKISNQRIESGWFDTTLYFDVTAISEGASTICIVSADGTISTNISTVLVKKTEKIRSFGEFKDSEQNLYVGDSQEFSWHISPKGLSREDVILNISNEEVIEINEISFCNDESTTLFRFSVIGIAEGQCEINLQSESGNVQSKPLIFIVENAPVVRTFGRFSQDVFRLEVGDTYEFTQHMLPSGVSREDFSIEISDNSIISVTENRLENEDDKTAFQYTVKALAPGESTIQLISSDQKTTSQVLTFIVSAKDTSRIVYITPTGEKYHFSAACAGENASSITLNQAKAHGYQPCKKCAK